MIWPVLPACVRPPEHRRKDHHGKQKEYTEHFEQDLAPDRTKGLEEARDTASYAARGLSRAAPALSGRCP